MMHEEKLGEIPLRRNLSLRLFVRNVLKFNGQLKALRFI